MQRRGYVPGAAALLAVLLTACSGGAGAGESADDSKPGEAGSPTQTAEPGRYRTLPDPCRAIDHATLDRMLPGLKTLDEEQRTKAYEGSAEVTYDTDRRVGCSWKVESPDSTHHLDVDFERVVSYNGAVSDDARAEEVYAKQETAADLPEPSPDEEQSADATGDGGTNSPSAEASDGQSATPDDAQNPDKNPDKSPETGNSTDGTENTGGDSAESGDEDGASASADGESDAGDGEPGSGALPEALQSRTLDGIGDEAFVDDQLTSAGSTARHRTVTVVFRTSNVVVTIQYDEQPARGTEVPDSKELQDKARELAAKLAEQFAD